MDHGRTEQYARRCAGAGGGDERVLRVIRENEASMQRLARRHSLCADDAEDACQRAIEIFLRRADRVQEATAGAWLRTVVKHEAMAIRAARLRALPSEEVDFDARRSEVVREPDDRAADAERVARAGEALRACKPDEATALLLLAAGNSYARIGELTGWSYTKVNRCVTEGRARFLRTFAAIERGEACERWRPVLELLAAGRLPAGELTGVRSHLPGCTSCRALLRDYRAAPSPDAAAASVGRLGRAREGLTAAIGDVTVAVVGKAHAVAEAIPVAKAAAVAASAAAVAGGSGAVAGHRESGSAGQRAAGALRVASATPAPRPAAQRQNSRSSRDDFGFERGDGPGRARPRKRSDRPPERAEARRDARRDNRSSRAPREFGFEA